MVAIMKIVTISTMVLRRPRWLDSSASAGLFAMPTPSFEYKPSTARNARVPKLPGAMRAPKRLSTAIAMPYGTITSATPHITHKVLARRPKRASSIHATLISAAATSVTTHRIEASTTPIANTIVARLSARSIASSMRPRRLLSNSRALGPRWKWSQSTPFGIDRQHAHQRDPARTQQQVDRRRSPPG